MYKGGCFPQGCAVGASTRGTMHICEGACAGGIFSPGVCAQPVSGAQLEWLLAVSQYIRLCLSSVSQYIRLCPHTWGLQEQ